MSTSFTLNLNTPLNLLILLIFKNGLGFALKHKTINLEDVKRMKFSFHGITKLFLTALTLLFCSTSHATLITTVSGYFTNVSGGDPTYYRDYTDELNPIAFDEANEVSHIGWGNDTGTDRSQSRLEFSGYEYNNIADMNGGTVPSLILGTLTLNNGVTGFGSEAQSLTLNMLIEQYDDSDPGTITYSNADKIDNSIIITTENIGTPQENQDNICFQVGEFLDSTANQLCLEAEEDMEITAEVFALIGSIGPDDLIPITTGGDTLKFLKEGGVERKFIDAATGAIVVEKIPEPSSAALFLMGFGLLSFAKMKSWKNRKTS